MIKKIGMYEIVEIQPALKVMALVSKTGKVLTVGFIPHTFKKEGTEVKLISANPALVTVSGYAQEVAAYIVKTDSGHQVIEDN